LAERVLDSSSAVLVAGGERTVRSRLLAELAAELERRGSDTIVVTADLGLPFLGPPGAVTRLRRSSGSWAIERVEPLCTLDAARFRLPLLLAVRRALDGVASAPLLVEVPRLTRGMSASEILTGIARALDAKTVISLGSLGELRNELEALSVEVLDLGEETGSSLDRASARTTLWSEFLESAVVVAIPLQGLPLLGAPPPPTASSAFPGRQIGVLGSGGEALGFGEILAIENGTLRALVRSLAPGEPRSLVVRDARRDDQGQLGTDRPVESATAAETGDSDLRAGVRASELRPPVSTLSSAKALLVNGIFGDPLLHVRLRHRKRSLLFDLGETALLPARIVHQVTDVFISHAHFDHIGGFLSLLRSSIGSPHPRSLYGPPGLAAHIEGMIAGIRWDRIGDRGPVFLVNEVHPGKLTRFRLQAGRAGGENLEERALRDDVLLEEPDFRVRARTLDHGIPVLAFAFEETTALFVRADAIAAQELTPGPWLSYLKRLLLEGRRERMVPLPDGSQRKASELEAALICSRPGQKLAYATDLDESEENHRALAELARGARLFYCEASFVEEDRDLARATQHLTAKGCARIAASAGVEKLVPFHFSKRYELDAGRIYREVMEVFPATVVAR
jgi:ribonuclease BN (tRNA processing enzyme)